MPAGFRNNAADIVQNPRAGRPPPHETKLGSDRTNLPSFARLGRRDVCPYVAIALANSYFNENMALTWAVTDTDCGVNSVGAGAAPTLIFIIAPAMGATRTFSNVSTEA